MFILLFFSLLAIISLIGFSLYTGIGPVPTSPKIKKIMGSLALGSGEIYELGSGWGTLAFPLAKANPQAQIRGYELSPIPWLFSWFKQKIEGPSNIKFKRKDFFSLNLEGATGVVCYLYPGAMDRLKIKFESELKPGSFVLTHTFRVPGWIPTQTWIASDLFQTPIYLYHTI